MLFSLFFSQGPSKALVPQERVYCVAKMSYAHADTCTDKHMQSPGQFVDWALEKTRTALWDGLCREVGAGGEAACEVVTKAGFYTRLGYAVTKCEITGAVFPGSILDAPAAT
jgi:hypothetical protein